MLSIDCKICQEKNVDDSHFWKSHKIKLQDYLTTHHPRIDLFSKLPIIFRSKKQYLTATFNNRKNLHSYLDSNTIEDCISYLKEALHTQSKANDWIYIPSEIEILSYINPRIGKIDKFFDFYKFCKEELGLQTRFENPKIDIFTELKKETELDIITDTREQKPVLTNTIVQKLNYGDYALNLNNHTYAVERKSLPDFLKTLTSDYDRFEREVIRAKESNGYLFILVESSLKDSLYFEENPIFKKNSHGRMRITGEYVFSNVRKLLKQYNHIQFFFVNGRDEFTRYLKLILSNAEILSQTDLQMNYHSKLI